MTEIAQEHLHRQVEVLERHVAQDVMVRPLDQLLPAEALQRAALSGLYRLIEIVETPLAKIEDQEARGIDYLKQNRLIGDMALGSGKLFMRAAEAEFRAKRNDDLGKLLEMLREATEKK